MNVVSFKVRSLRQNMEKIGNGMDKFNLFLRLLKYVPNIKVGVEAVSTSLRVIRPPYDKALGVLRKIDSGSDKVRQKCEKGIQFCDKSK